MVAHDQNKPTLFISDASDTAIGGAVAQQDESGALRYIALFSRKLSPTQRNYSATKLEALGVLLTVRRFQHYATLQNIIWSDHKSLQQAFFTSEDAILTRWRQLIHNAIGNFRVVHVPGSDNLVCDALSRSLGKGPTKQAFGTKLRRIRSHLPLGVLAAVAESAVSTDEHFDLCDTDSQSVMTVHERELYHLTHGRSAPTATADTIGSLSGGDPYVAAYLVSGGLLLSSDLVEDALKCRELPMTVQREEACALSAMERAAAEARSHGQSPPVRPLPSMIPDLTVELIRREQQLDPYINADRLICSKFPQTLSRLALHHEHVAGFALHEQSSAMLKRLQSRFYWPKMRTQVHEHIQDCDWCRVHHGFPRKKALLHSEDMDHVLKPLDKVHVDFVRVQPASSGESYVFVAQDRATRAIFLAASHRADAKTAAYNMIKFSSLYGPPKLVVHDHGPEFINEFFRTIHKIMGTDLVTTTVRWPQANLAERPNRWIPLKIKALAERARDWPLLLPVVSMTYNCTPHSSTGVKPFEALFYREARPLVSTARRMQLAQQRFTSASARYKAQLALEFAKEQETAAGNTR